VGQLSDPYDQGEDAELDITISGLPGEPDEPHDAGGPGGAERVREPRAGDAATTADDLDEDDDLEDDDLDGEPEDGDDLDLDDVDARGDGLGESEEEVAYGLDDFDDDQLDALFDALDDADLPYLWDGEELFVRASDEQAVDEILERVAHPHELAAEDGDGGGWLLGELFVVADRLQHDPEEHESVATLLQLADAAEEAEPPYGLAPAEWEHLQGKVTALATVLEQDHPDPDEAIAAARDLRNTVRPYV
jgi:hypothetical protein